MNSFNRYYTKEELLPLMQKHRLEPVIVFDLETNGLNRGSSVLSCSAVKLLFDASASGDNQPFRQIDSFERYYFSVEAENLSAIRVNGLSANVLTERREGHDWPPYFRDDRDFAAFCTDAGLLVAHNIDFDIQFVPYLSHIDQFCTMKSNTVAKYPRLSELALTYGIRFNSSQLHQSRYDTDLTAAIFQKMVAEILPDLVQGELF